MTSKNAFEGSMLKTDWEAMLCGKDTRSIVVFLKDDFMRPGLEDRIIPVLITRIEDENRLNQSRPLWPED